jgi:diguanylate cyclase (GGDEF)-like protein
MGSLLLLQLIAFAFVAQVAKRMLDADCASQCALYQQATHDSLVGLVNHAEFRRCVSVLDSAPAGPYALVFIDLDHFKEVNDTAGHGAGDRLLAHVGTILREEKRKSDVAARVGGDEFAILMEYCNDREALRVARAVLRRINEFKLEHEGWLLHATASIGIACSGGDTLSAASAFSARDVLEAADQACYTAKRSGRNRIELAPQVGDDAQHDVRHAACY